MSNQQRPKRQRQAKVVFLMKERPIINRSGKITKKKQVQVLETRAAEEPPTEPVQKLLDAPMVEDSPPCRVSFTAIIQLWAERDPFSLFIKFLSEASITGTNKRVCCLST
jgi:hypothetical protein